MSPRSEELMRAAGERRRGAEVALEGGAYALAVSAAYYAMLYAARAALSEEDRHAKTHRGTWDLFAEVFVESGRFDRELLRAARRREDLRAGADYDARTFSQDEAAAVLADADTFVAAVARLLET